MKCSISLPISRLTKQFLYFLQQSARLRRHLWIQVVIHTTFMPVEMPIESGLKNKDFPFPGSRQKNAPLPAWQRGVLRLGYLYPRVIVGAASLSFEHAV
jgi:hypothetical protein